MRAASWGAVAVLWLILSAAAAAPAFPPLSGRVVDEAGILSARTRDQITEMLAGREKATGEQIVVATVKSLQGYAIEDFGYQLGRSWGIGQKGRDNGAILLVAPNERKVRIEVGYGLEGRLTDAQSRVIIEQVILPAFRRGDFDAGVRDGAAAVLRVLGGEQAVAGGGKTNDNALFPAIFIPLWCIVFFGIWGIVLGGMWRHRHDPHRQGHGSVAWFGGSSGSSSGGGFSGGGGSFGGGGASGSW
ncbi:MAG: TPM domain-containing protein [Alphaproteobacteria bacterium]